MPVRTAWSTFAQTGTAYAQAPPLQEGDLDAFADRVALETLVQLEARAPAISEALRLEQAELTALIQERLGPEVEQLHAQALTSQSVLARSQAILNRSDGTIDDSEDLIDDSKESLDDTEDLLDASEDTLDDSEEMLKETRKTLQRSKELLEEAEAMNAKAQALAERFAEDIEDLRAIFDRLPVRP
jgi:hypothetical protein